MPKPQLLCRQTGACYIAIHCSAPIGPTCAPKRTPCRSRRRIQQSKHRETEAAVLIFLQRRQDLTIPESRGGCGKFQELQCAPSSGHLVACSNQCSSPISLLFLQTTFFVVDIWFGKFLFFFLKIAVSYICWHLQQGFKLTQQARIFLQEKNDSDTRNLTPVLCLSST